MHSLKQHTHTKKKEKHVKLIKKHNIPLLHLARFFITAAWVWGGETFPRCCWSLLGHCERSWAAKLRHGFALVKSWKLLWNHQDKGIRLRFFCWNTLNVGFNYHPMKFTHRNSPKSDGLEKCSSLQKWLCLVVVTYFVRFFWALLGSGLRRIHLLLFKIGTLFCTLVLNIVTKPDLFLVVQLVTAVISSRGDWIWLDHVLITREILDMIGHAYCWWFRNPAPPGMYKILETMGWITNLNWLAGFLNHQQYQPWVFGKGMKWHICWI